MNRDGFRTEWRSAALAVALFAVTLNFLQPLVHAALMRSGAPQALWTVFCNASPSDPDPGKGSKPVAVGTHECCLGLAHAAALVQPPSVFTVLERIAFVANPIVRLEQPTPVGIRDGPTRPRGPPTLV